ncbi:MAG: glycosyltransferase [Pirellulaceae bacterium]
MNSSEPSISWAERPADSERKQRLADAEQFLRQHRVAVLVVAYNAERTIGSVLERIPAALRPLFAEICVFDDSSRDQTVAAAVAAGRQLGMENLRVCRTPVNQGYGGNQILGYEHAIRQGCDFVVMLHGDGQYAPEYLDDMLLPFADPAVAATLGSRMMRKLDALRGRMPMYKWLGNQTLSAFQNHMLEVSLTEFHTGYRGYRTAVLRRVPFAFNSHDFHFDTEILIQLISAGERIVEVPIPTHYGDEVCHVNGFRYAWDCVKAVIKYRLFRMGLFYNPLLDTRSVDDETYHFKRADNSLHQFVLRQDFSEQRVLELGAARGYISSALAEAAREVVAVDRRRPTLTAPRLRCDAVDLNGEFDKVLGPETFDSVLALDVLEHLAEPEQAVQKIARLLRPDGRLYASTANIGFFIMRGMLLLGQFNYGKRGILDMTHTRLFTIGSFRRLLRDYGFHIESLRGFGPPIRDQISSRFPYSWIDGTLGWLARVWPRLFAFNFLVVARRRPSLDETLAATLDTSQFS